jgi:carboxymethylenebutenolidase
VRVIKYFFVIFLIVVVTGCASTTAAERSAQRESAGGSAASVASSTRPAKVYTKKVAYTEVDGKAVEGYLSQPADNPGNLSGLIVIHEWWGLSDNVLTDSRLIAAEGYVVLTVDLFDGESSAMPGVAMQLTDNFSENPGAAQANLLAAYEYLDTVVQAPKIGALGWGLGGQWSLETALLLPDTLDAVVMYYGAVVTDELRLSSLQMPILGIFAEKDPLVPAATVVAFDAALEALDKNAELTIYPGTLHGFANPSSLGYNPEAANAAWVQSIAFLKAQLDAQ